MSDHGDEIDVMESDDLVTVLKNRLAVLEQLQDTAKGSVLVDRQREAADIEEQLALLEPVVSHPVTATGLRRSTRVSRPTEKLTEMQNRDSEKTLKKLMGNFQQRYEAWRTAAKAVRAQLKICITRESLGSGDVSMQLHRDAVVLHRDAVVHAYDELRRVGTPNPATRRQVDTCGVVTSMLVDQVDGGPGFNCDDPGVRSAAGSIFSSQISRRTGGRSRHSDTSQDSSAKRLQAAVELATQEVELKAMHEKASKQAELEELERSQEGKRRDIAFIEKKKEVDVARAKLRVYDAECQDQSLVDFENVLERNIVEEPVIPTSIDACIHRDDPIVRQHDDPNAALVKALTESISLSRLPAPEPAVFNGDLLQFTDWQASFITLIGNRCTSSTEKMFYLRRYVGGEARKTIENYFLQNTTASYDEAWHSLQRKYGDPFRVGQAFRDKLYAWSKVGPKDCEGLSDLSNFLKSCRAASQHVAGLQVLDNCHENQRILTRLPDWLTARWNRLVFFKVRSDEIYPSFSTFVDFVSEEAQIACNPICSLQALKGVENTSHTEHMSTPAREGRHNRASALATTTLEKSGKPVQKMKDEQKTCCLCNRGGHLIDSCFTFSRKSMQDKRKFVMENRLCFGCLKEGHRSKECRERQTCKKCEQKHPTYLHDEDRMTGVKEVESAVSLSVSGRGTTSTSTVVSVWISTLSHPGEEILVYALLDTQSDTTFVSQDTTDSLRAVTEPVRLKLTTMTSNNSIVHCQRVTGLSVRGLTSATRIRLPPAYTRDVIPGDRSHIPTDETARRWSHLSSIADELQPLKECEVGLLIGYDCAQALAPRQVLTGKDNEPYAQRTDLGWSIVGRTTPRLNLENVTALNHRITTRSEFIDVKYRSLPFVCLETDRSTSAPQRKATSTTVAMT